MTDRVFDAGGVVITDTSTVTGPFRKLVALTDAVLAAGTVAQDLTGTLDGLAMKAGTELVACFTTVKLTSGNAVAYR